MFFISALWKPKKHTFINPLVFSRLYNMLVKRYDMKVKMYDMRVDLYALSSHKNEYPAHFPTYIRHMGHFQLPCPPACLADRTKAAAVTLRLNIPPAMIGYSIPNNSHILDDFILIMSLVCIQVGSINSHRQKC